jgi:hypothetical protein
MRVGMIRSCAFAVGLVAAAALLAMTECSSVSGMGAADGAACTESIQASSYDQTCRADSDCVAVGQVVILVERLAFEQR